MALVWAREIQYTNEPTLFRYSNTTVYGGAEEDRNEGAEILLAAHVVAPEHTGEEGVEEFLTIDSTPYLTKTLYDINNTSDGHYRFETLRFPIWSVATPYIEEVRDVNNEITTYASLVYYTVTGKFYKAIDSQTGGLPTNTLFFEEITDFTIDDVRTSDKIVVSEYNTIFDHRGRLCVKEELYKLLYPGVCLDLQKMMPYLKKSIYLKGARAKADDNQPEQGEIITRTLENSCGCD